MEFIARTVTHPNAKLSREIAEEQLIGHPQFKKGSVVVAMTQTPKGWVATIHEPKLEKKAGPPPFGPPSDEGDAPSDEAKPELPEDESSDDSDSEDAPDDDTSDDSDDKKDEPKGEKAELSDILDLVKQVAQAVGVPTGDEDPAAGPEGDLGGPPHPGGPDGPPSGPEGGPPHDETSDVPGDPSTKQIIHRKAPPGAVPIGAPAFASTKKAKVASFELNEEVPADFTIRQAKDEIESIYGPHGYTVKKIAEAHENGKRFIRARVSVR